MDKRLVQITRIGGLLGYSKIFQITKLLGFSQIGGLVNILGLEKIEVILRCPLLTRYPTLLYLVGIGQFSRIVSCLGLTKTWILHRIVFTKHITKGAHIVKN